MSKRMWIKKPVCKMCNSELRKERKSWVIECGYCLTRYMAMKYVKGNKYQEMEEVPEGNRLYWWEEMNLPNP